MTKFDLFLDLLCSINQLLEGGLTKKNISEVRLLVDHSFDRFEEREIANSSELSTIDGVAIKALDMSKLLHDYPRVLNAFQNTARGAELLDGLFTTLEELLYLGVTFCNTDIARRKLASLFDTYEQGEVEIDEAEQFEVLEDLLTEIDDYMKEEREKYPEIFNNDEAQEATTPTEL